MANPMVGVVSKSITSNQVMAAIAIELTCLQYKLGKIEFNQNYLVRLGKLNCGLWVIISVQARETRILIEF
jgi:hypothetical protein